MNEQSDHVEEEIKKEEEAARRKIIEAGLQAFTDRMGDLTKHDPEHWASQANTVGKAYGVTSGNLPNWPSMGVMSEKKVDGRKQEAMRLASNFMGGEELEELLGNLGITQKDWNDAADAAYHRGGKQAEKNDTHLLVDLNPEDHSEDGPDETGGRLTLRVQKKNYGDGTKKLVHDLYADQKTGEEMVRKFLVSLSK